MNRLWSSTLAVVLVLSVVDLNAVLHNKMLTKPSALSRIFLNPHSSGKSTIFHGKTSKNLHEQCQEVVKIDTVRNWSGTMVPPSFGNFS